MHSNSTLCMPPVIYVFHHTTMLLVRTRSLWAQLARGIVKARSLALLSWWVPGARQVSLAIGTFKEALISTHSSSHR